MPRLMSQQQVKEYEFATFRLEITETATGGRRVTGYLKSLRTGLVTDTLLFDDEDGLGALADDFGEALQIVTAEKQK